MLQAKDLRLGNSILHEGKIITVDFDVFSHIEAFPHVLNRLSGIEITPNILNECKFQSRPGGASNTFEWHIGTNPVTHDWLFCLTEQRDICSFWYRNGFHRLYHLHELQNLFYSLTQIEIEFKQLV